MGKNRKFCPTINLDKIFSVAGEGTYDAAKNASDGKAPVIDLVKLGYFKLLGNGQINVPVIVKAKYFSKLNKKLRLLEVLAYSPLRNQNKNRKKISPKKKKKKKKK